MFSMAGQITLSQSVISAVPSYVMQGCLILSRVLNNLDKVNKNFIWGSSKDKKKIHMVSWDKITKPKARGGIRHRKGKREKSNFGSKTVLEDGELKQ